MRVFTAGGYKNIELGDTVLIARCGSGHTIFGECAKLTRQTSTQLVFTTESGSVVKSNRDRLKPIGHFNEYFISLVDVDGRDNLIKSRVHYWSDKKCCICYK